MGKASREKKARKTQKWELMEKAVCLLEKCLVPGARVEHNQKLTNYRTAGLTDEPLKRQGDVIIRIGQPPRDTFWLLEVQKRGRNVEQKDYDGWVAKMDQVGAAGLIGVAEKSFPRSVLLDAKTRGPRVKLLTLSQLEGNDWPIRVMGNSVVISGIDIKMKFMKMTLVSPKAMPPLPSMPIDQRVFRRGDTGENITPRWLSQMASMKYRHLYYRSPEGTIPAVEWEFVPPPEWRLQTQHGLDWFPVSNLKFTSDLIVRYTRLPMTCSEYKPVEFGPILAYALTAGGPLDGKDVNIRIVARKDPDGTVHIMAVEFEGFPENALVEFGFAKERPGPEAS